MGHQLNIIGTRGSVQAFKNHSASVKIKFSNLFQKRPTQIKKWYTVLDLSVAVDKYIFIGMYVRICCNDKYTVSVC